jgi:ribonuclease HIII
MPVRSLEEAQAEISTILRSMVKVHEVFLVQGVRLTERTSQAGDEEQKQEQAVQRKQVADKTAVTPVPTERFEQVDVEILASRLASDGYTVERQGADSSSLWQLRHDQFEVFCSAKRPGRVTIRGEGARAFSIRYAHFLEPKDRRTSLQEDEELFPDIKPAMSSWIGVDESGKGDVFGPLVIAGVFVEDGQVEHLLRLGVRDSKTLSDAAILRLSTEIKRICPHHAILAVEPVEYNLLYERLQNLNKLLALKHAEVISRLATITPATRAISDQFADERLIPEALAALGCRIDLEQRPRAEDDIAVASASILARAEFVSWLDRSSETLGYTLPPGVAQVTIDAGRRIVAHQGRKALAKFAKLHFRTVREMLS